MAYEPLKSHQVKVLVVWTYAIAFSALTLETISRTYASSILRLVTSEDYGYIIVGLVSSVYVIYLSIRDTGIPRNISVGRILGAASLFFLSLLLLALARADHEHIVQLEGLSFTLLSIGLLFLLYNARKAKEVLPLLGLFVLTPVPSWVADSITPILSRCLGKAVAYLTGIRFIEGFGYSVIEISSPLGLQRLTVEAVCSGILVVGSVLPVVPLLLYVAGFSNAKTSRKVLAVLVSLALSFLVGLAGSTSRLALAVIVGKCYGIESALYYLRYLSSAVFSAISIAVVARAISGALKPQSQALGRAHFSLSLAGAILILMGFATLLYHISFTNLIAPAMPVASTLRLETRLEKLLENPSVYMLKNATLLSSEQDPWLIRVLGAIAVYNVSISYGEAPVRGYIEIVDTPARLRTWRLCLAVQGYEVTGTWSELAKGRKIGYALASKNSTKYLLAYTVVPISTLDTSADVTVYARVSVLIPVSKGLSNAVEVAREILLNAIAPAEGHAIPSYIKLLTAISISALVLIFLSFITAFSAYLYKIFLSILRNIVRRG